MSYEATVETVYDDQISVIYRQAGKDPIAVGIDLPDDHDPTPAEIRALIADNAKVAYSHWDLRDRKAALAGRATRLEALRGLMVAGERAGGPLGVVAI